jgi:two-component system, chemotaxis family, CheB/CheR fusion protein
VGFAQFDQEATKGAQYLVRLIPYREADAAIRGVVVTIIDVTGIAEAEERQKILIAELNHRVKNMLAVVISLVNRMARRASSPEAFQTALIGCLHSMSRAFELLSRENWTEASLGELVRQELAPFDLKRIAIKGPNINLKPRQSLSVGMLVHELATNAAKYGALSVSSGRIDYRLHDEDSYQIAEELAAHDIPFAFLTEYDLKDIPYCRKYPCLQSRSPPRCC